MAAMDCIRVIRDAAGEVLSDDEVLEIADAIMRRRKRLIAEGRLDDLDAALAAAAQEADTVRLAAVLARKHAALNAIARDRLDTRLAAHVDAGLRPDKAILAVLEGTTANVPGGRVSVAASRLAFEGRSIGALFADIQREKPHLMRMLDDEALNADAVREMFELREGGNPGVSGNADARFLAQTYAAHAEAARVTANRLGASIGKLDGWAGPQSHDPYRLLKAGRETWRAAIEAKLDLARTFPDLVDDAGRPDMAAIRDVLDDSYTTIVTGRDNAPSAREKGEFTGPANLAKSLSRHRVFHFAGADAWLAYNGEFGHGNLAAAMHAHLARLARVSAQMETLGPNPRVMLAAVVESLQRRVRNDPRLDDAAKAKQIAKLTDDPQTPIGKAMAEMQGLTLTPADAGSPRSPPAPAPSRPWPSSAGRCCRPFPIR